MRTPSVSGICGTTRVRCSPGPARRDDRRDQIRPAIARIVPVKERHSPVLTCLVEIGRATLALRGLHRLRRRRYRPALRDTEALRDEERAFIVAGFDNAPGTVYMESPDQKGRPPSCRPVVRRLSLTFDTLRADALPRSLTKKD